MISYQNKKRDWITWLYITLISVFLLSSCAEHKKTAPDSLLIESVTIIDPITGSKSNQWVLVKNGVIQSVQDDRPAEIKPETTIVDGQGKFLIPGLWDSHVHLTFEADFSAKAQLKHFLRFGVTSVRDTGGQLSQLLKVREYASSTPLSSPRVYISGPLLDGKPRIYDGGPGFPEIGIEIDSPLRAREVVDELWQQGADFIKIYELVSPVVLKALLQQANLRSLPVAAHVPLSVGAYQIAAEQIGSLEHLRNFEYACSTETESLLRLRKQALQNTGNLRGGALRHGIHSRQRPRAMNSADQTRCMRLIEQFAISGIAQVPTLGLVGVFDTSYWQDPLWLNNVQSLPKGPSRRYQMRAMQIRQTEQNSTKPGLYNWSKDMLAKLHEASVPIIAGSDAPILLQVPGISLHDELWMLTQSGLSPMAALQAATIEAARFFKLEDKTGSIAPDKIADLVLLDANPLLDIRNTRQVAAVINKGYYLDKTHLASLSDSN